MLTLIYGGASSGKSSLAEHILCQSVGSPCIYLATMQPFGLDAKARIERHKNLRQGKDFLTLERYTNLASLTITQGSAVLLECLPTLLANELFDPQGAKNDAQTAILQGIFHLLRQSHDLVVVSGDLFSDGHTYTPQTMRYLKLLGNLNHILAQKADRVIETVCAIPIVHKGDLL